MLRETDSDIAYFDRFRALRESVHLGHGENAGLRLTYVVLKLSQAEASARA